MNLFCLDIDLNNVCRICLSQTDMSEHLFNIFADAIVDGMLVSLPDVIGYCMDLEVSDAHGMPHQICQSCKAKMFKFYVFKQKCHRTDSVLREMLENQAISEEAVEERTEMYDKSSHVMTTEAVDESNEVVLQSPESILASNNVEELIEGDYLAGSDTAEILEYCSPSADNLILNEQDDEAASLSASNQEEYIEEVYEELESTSPTMFISEHNSSAQISVTISQTNSDSDGCFTCEICGIKTKRLKRHMKFHNDSNAVLGQMHFYSCSACRTMFLSENDCREHSKTCPRSPSMVVGDEEEAEGAPSMGTCLENNLNTNGYCGICEASYANTVQLKQHILTHLDKFACPFEGCGCEYASLARLNIHVNSKHVDYFSPSCPHCHENIDRADLHQHLRFSCKAKHIACSHCDKKFLSSRALSQHLKRLEQTFQCAQCDKSYSSRASFKLHLRTHTGERPFVCTLCNKSYKTASLRTAHMDSHIEGKTFECSICGKFLQTRPCYRNHIKRHLEERNHGCDVCGKKFYAKRSLRLHQEKVHKICRPPGL